MSEKKFVEMQKNIRDNNEELQNFLLDMDSWEKDMKERDERLRKSETSNEQKDSKKKKQDTSKAEKQNKKSKVEVTGDTSDSSSEEGDIEAEEEMMELRKKQQGNEEKEKGNNHFKKGEWKKAIECYTRGLTIDPLNPLLSANRAMALLKIKSFAAAEADCNTCLSLDDTYVKAYLRRAAARFELKKYDEAKEDVKKVIEIEPTNMEAKKLLKSLYQQYGKECEEDSQRSESETVSSKDKKQVTFKPEAQPKVFSSVDSSSIVSPTQKPPHLRSKVPLKKIAIELEKKETPLKLDAPWSPCKSCNTAKATTTKTTTKNPTVPSETKVIDTILQKESESTSIPPCPTSFIEFQRGWEKVYAVTNVAFKYLTQIPSECYHRLFGDLLESDVLSQMLHVLSRGAADEAVEPLQALTTVSRFDMLKLFLSTEDKKAVQRILDSFCSSDGLSEQLTNAYLS